MPTPFDFNPFDEDTRRNPYALYARGRAEFPVFVHAGLPISVVSAFRYDDIQAVLKDPTQWSNVFPPPPGIELRPDLPPNMLNLDPPEHTRLRGLVNQAFTPRIVRQLEPRMERIAHELLDSALAARRVDLVQALSYPLPVIVIAEMIGVPIDDREQFKHWSDALVEDLGVGILTPPTVEVMHKQIRIVDEMRVYFTRLVDERRTAPREDLLSGLIAAESEGSRLTFDEMLQMLILLLVAGNETTTTLIGNAAITLMEHPDQLAHLRADLDLMPTAIDEVLRFSSPIQLTVRRAKTATTIRGHHVDEGTNVVLWLGSANRDEQVFEHPDTFDVARVNNYHLAFGFGPHFCLGSNLARVEARVAMRVLLQRTRGLRRSDDAPLPLHPSFIFRSVTSLPVELVPA
ncbi:MAG TPA: cytochrome P450 [Candidatus Binatia bacterium]|nr:cytochrome P450 [Candidatus Binatia bacterium]